MPTLEEVLAKDANTLTDEDKNVLAENKEKLTAEQQKTYGFEVTAEVKTVEVEAEAEPINTNNNEETPVETVEQKELAGVMASIKTGEKVLVDGKVLASLQETDKNYRQEKAEAAVKAHAARGAIKADQIGAWTDRLVRDSSVEDLLKNLPDNQVMASEQGSDKGSGIAASALDQVNAEVKKLKEADANLSDSDAISRVMASNHELQTRYYQELQEGSVK